MSRPLDVVLRQTPDGQLWYRTTGDLTDRWVGMPDPLYEQTRTYYGRALTPEAIESSIIQADRGFMRPLTDLIYEASRIDPHWSMCDRKRIRAVLAAKTNVIPASGQNIDATLAKKLADAVRQNLAQIPNLKREIARLNWAHRHGRSAAEKVWSENKATLGSDSLKWRVAQLNWIHPQRLSFGPEREIRIRDDRWGGMGFEARGLDLRQYPFKFIGFLPEQYDEYPEREGYGCRALYFSFFKRFGKREQLILLEQFGRPWRHLEEIDPANKAVQADALKAGAEELDQTSANSVGYAPPGTKIVTEQPQQGAGQVHKDVLEDSNDEISKLILGEVRTSDAKPSALGSDGDKVADEVQDEVKNEDALGLSDLLTEQLSCDIIELNFGPELLDHAPRIEVFYESPPDRTEEIDRTVKAFSLGVPLKESQVYERIGFDQPAPGDVTVKQAPQPAGPFGAPPKPGAQEGAPPPADSGDPAANLTAGAPPDFMTLARAAHVLELTRYLSVPSGVVRAVVPPKPSEP